MSRPSDNGAITPEMREQVTDVLARGGLNAVYGHFAKEPNLRALLDYANGELGGVVTKKELKETPWQVRMEREVLAEEATNRLRAQREAREALNAETAAPPPEFPTHTLAQDLKTPPRKQPYVIDGLLPIEGNGVLVGAYKTGKTVLAMNLAKALADDEPFLGIFDTHLRGNVAYLNYELSADMFRDWMRALDVTNQDRIVPFHLRGQTLPFWTKAVHSHTVEWLKSHKTGFLIMDPGARAWRPLVDEENSNSQMAGFVEHVDELKRDAGVRECFIATHTGRALQEQDNERGRGATRLEDWMDAGWYLTKNRDQVRFLRAMGRDVDQEAVALDFDAETKTLAFTGQTRTQVRDESLVVGALQALADMEARNERATFDDFRKAVPGEKTAREPAIRQAVDEGYIKVKKEAHNAKVHTLTKRGRSHLLKAGGDA